MASLQVDAAPVTDQVTNPTEEATHESPVVEEKLATPTPEVDSPPLTTEESKEVGWLDEEEDTKPWPEEEEGHKPAAEEEDEEDKAAMSPIEDYPKVKEIEDEDDNEDEE